MENFALAPQKILIVDDEASNRKVLKELLQDKAEIIFAKNGEQAISLAEKHVPDLILLDVIMPDKTGFEVIQEIKSTHKTKDITVIFITGLTESDDEALGFELGGSDYIYKPFKPNVVQARVNMQLELIRQRKMLENYAHLDALTGVNNRRKLDRVLVEELAANTRVKSHLAVAIVDVDYFKPFNDNYGHGAGDIALKQVTECLLDTCKRPRDFVARYGGEEFVMILPDCDETGVQILLSQLQQTVHQRCIHHQFSPIAPHLTVSIGSVVVCPEKTLDASTVLSIADNMLYKAKSGGRDQFHIVSSATYESSLKN